jgi:drug/metabolite transporter (DMT)-like permease
MTAGAPAIPGPRARAADLILLIAFALWGMNYAAMKFALGDFEPLTLPVVRFGLAGVILLAVLRRREGSITIPRADMPLLALTAFLGISVSQVALVLGLGYTTAANSALLSASGPLFVMIAASVFGIEQLRRRHWASVALGLVGVGLIVGAVPALPAAGADLRGDLLVLVYVAASSAPALLYPALLRRNSVLRVLTFEVVIGTLILLPVSAVSLVDQDYAAISPAAWGAVLYAAIATGVIANLLYFEGVRRVGPSRATIYQYLQSIFGAVAGVVLLAEGLTLSQIIGCVVVIGSVVLSRSAPTVGASTTGLASKSTALTGRVD